MTLTAAYDAAKTAATQASVDDIPTNAELATALGTADDATLAAIAALNNLSSAQAQTAAAAALTAYDPPTNAEMEARTIAAANYATATALAAVDDFVDTEIAAIKAVTDKLDTALVLDEASVPVHRERRWQLAPTGGRLHGPDQRGRQRTISCTNLSPVGCGSASIGTQLAAIVAGTDRAQRLASSWHATQGGDAFTRTSAKVSTNVDGRRDQARTTFYLQPHWQSARDDAGEWGDYGAAATGVSTLMAAAMLWP